MSERFTRDRRFVSSRERESWGGLNGRGRGAPCAASTDALAQAYRGERREVLDGADNVSCTGRQGDLGGQEGEALGGLVARTKSGYSVRAHCSALQSTSLAGMAIVLAPWAWPIVSNSSRGE